MPHHSPQRYSQAPGAQRTPRPGITPDALGGSYKATVTIVDSVFEAASGTFGVRLELPNTASTLPAGCAARRIFRRCGA